MGTSPQEIQKMKREIEFLSKLIKEHKEKEKLSQSTRTLLLKAKPTIIPPHLTKPIHKPHALCVTTRKVIPPSVPFKYNPKLPCLNPYKLDRTTHHVDNPVKSSSSSFAPRRKVTSTKISATASSKYKLVKNRTVTSVPVGSQTIVPQANTMVSMSAKAPSGKIPCPTSRLICQSAANNISKVDNKCAVKSKHKLIKSTSQVQQSYVLHHQPKLISVHNISKKPMTWLSSASATPIWLHRKRMKAMYLYGRRRVRGLHQGMILSMRLRAASSKHGWTKLKSNPLSSKMVMIGGLLYRSSKNKLSRANQTPKGVHKLKATRLKGTPSTLLIRGVRFQMDSTGRTLKRIVDTPSRPKVSESQILATPSMKRIDVGGNTYLETKPGVFVQTFNSQSRYFLNRAVTRSIRVALTTGQRKLKKTAKQYCMFYNRFGRCNKGDKCPYIHDPDKIAVCTRFLRGTCKLENCPFSHHIDPEKMPVCSFFLQGRCNSDRCPYRHVKVNPNAEVCKDFLRGYCAAGVKCKKMHILVCPQFLRQGKCDKGDKCPLTHRQRKPKKRKLSAVTSPKKDDKEKSLPDEGEEEKEKDAEETDGPGLPHKLPKLPSYISLREVEADELSRNQTRGSGNCEPPPSREKLRIRPLFLMKAQPLPQASPSSL